MNQRLLDFDPELELLDQDLARGLAAQPDALALREGGQQMALAADLLEVADQRQLAGFLSQLVAQSGPRGPSLLASATGTALLSGLRRAAQVLGPIASAARAGAAPMSDLKTRAAQLFGIELEGLSPEDKEFEVAQQFVRFATEAAKRAAVGRGDAPTRVRGALGEAAMRHAPGLLRAPALGLADSGRWQRKGDRIVLFDC